VVALEDRLQWKNNVISDLLSFKAVCKIIKIENLVQNITGNTIINISFQRAVV
jgi:hypothetical protein